MPTLPAQSSNEPQSTRTAMGDGSRRGVARRRTEKRPITDVDPSSSPLKKIKQTKTNGNGTCDFIEYTSGSEDDFNPTMKSWVPDRFEKAKMKRDAEQRKKFAAATEEKQMDTERERDHPWLARDRNALTYRNMLNARRYTAHKMANGRGKVVPQPSLPITPVHTVRSRNLAREIAYALPLVKRIPSRGLANPQRPTTIDMQDEVASLSSSDTLVEFDHSTSISKSRTAYLKEQSSKSRLYAGGKYIISPPYSDSDNIQGKIAKDTQPRSSDDPTKRHMQLTSPTNPSCKEKSDGVDLRSETTASKYNGLKSARK